MSHTPASSLYLHLHHFYFSGRAGRAAGGLLRHAGNAKQHVVHVRIHLSGTSAERDVQLPAWNALYQIRDFAQNVRSVHAHDAANNELPVRKLDKTTWRISHAESGAEVEYDIYLDQPGPFGAQYNSDHAFLIWRRFLMYPMDARDSQMTVTFIGLPEHWQVATALESLRPGVPSARGIFVARNYDRLVDAPIELGTFHETSFDANGATIRIAVDADPADYELKCAGGDGPQGRRGGNGMDG